MHVVGSGGVQTDGDVMHQRGWGWVIVCKLLSSSATFKKLYTGGGIKPINRTVAWCIQSSKPVAASPYSTLVFTYTWGDVSHRRNWSSKLPFVMVVKELLCAVRSHSKCRVTFGLAAVRSVTHSSPVSVRRRGERKEMLRSASC